MSSQTTSKKKDQRKKATSNKGKMNVTMFNKYKSAIVKSKPLIKL